jgi:hypothetical protein
MIAPSFSRIRFPDSGLEKHPAASEISSVTDVVRRASGDLGILFRKFSRWLNRADVGHISPFAAFRGAAGDSAYRAARNGTEAVPYSNFATNP